jgi:hypothetical protein
MPPCNIQIEVFQPDSEQLKAYARAFKEAIPKWKNDLGHSIFMSKEGNEEDADELLELISKASQSKCISLLKKFEIIPEALYRITEVSSRVTESLPIYTGIRQISFEGPGSVLAEAFFGAEIHLLDAAGRVLSIYHHEYSPKLGLGQMYLIDRNSDYEIILKGHEYDPTAIEIVGYASESISRTFSFQSEYGREYKVEIEGETEKIIVGTGENITVSSLKRLGRYRLMRKSNEDDADDGYGFPNTWVVKFDYHVGLHWENIPDFTIQYNTFPFLEGRDNWVLQGHINEPEEKIKLFKERWQDSSFIEHYLTTDRFSFQFMPTEIRSNRSCAEKFCIQAPVNFLFVDDKFKNDKQFVIDLIKAGRWNNTIYPYLTEDLRKDIDILIALKSKGRLYDLPSPTEIGPEKINNICEFVSNNQSRIEEVLSLFPNALHYAPASLLNNRELLLKALPLDNKLLSLLSETHRDDPEIIMAASSKYFAALEFASKRLCEDPQFVISILGINGNNIRFAADCFKDDEEVILNIVKDNRFALESASERLRKDKAFNLKALDHGAYYKTIHESLLDDRDIVLKEMQIHPHEFERVPDRLKSDREFVLAVVSQGRGYYRYIADCSFEIRDDTEIIKAIVSNCGWTLKYASERLRDDKEIVIKAISNNGGALEYASERLKNDKEIVLEAVRNDGSAIRYASESLKNDLLIIKTAKNNPYHSDTLPF